MKNLLSRLVFSRLAGHLLEYRFLGSYQRFWFCRWRVESRNHKLLGTIELEEWTKETWLEAVTENRAAAVIITGASQVALAVKNHLPMQETRAARVQSLSQEDPPVKEMQPPPDSCLENSMDSGAWWATGKVGREEGTQALESREVHPVSWNGNSSIISHVFYLLCQLRKTDTFTRECAIFFSFWC